MGHWHLPDARQQLCLVMKARCPLLPDAALHLWSRVGHQTLGTFAGGSPLLRDAHGPLAAGVRVAGVGHCTAGPGGGAGHQALRTLALRLSLLYTVMCLISYKGPVVQDCIDNVRFKSDMWPSVNNMPSAKRSFWQTLRQIKASTTKINKIHCIKNGWKVSAKEGLPT